MIARSVVRGVDGNWVRSVMGFALVPDAIFYLRCKLDVLVPRVLSTRAFDYWESGMDFLGYSDYYKSFVEYQKRMLAMFDELGYEYGFHDIDAAQSIDKVFRELRDRIVEVVSELKTHSVENTDVLSSTGKAS